MQFPSQENQGNNELAILIAFYLSKFDKEGIRNFKYKKKLY
jgi:hypothetical protein